MSVSFMHNRKEKKRVKEWASVPDTVFCANCGAKHEFDTSAEYNDFMTSLYEHDWLCEECGEKFFKELQ